MSRNQSLLRCTRRVKGKRVLLVRAKVARDVIPRELRKAGATVDVIEAYETVVPEASKTRLQAALEWEAQAARDYLYQFLDREEFRRSVGIAQCASGVEKICGESRSAQRIDWSCDFSDVARVWIAGRYRSEEIRYSGTGRRDSRGQATYRHSKAIIAATHKSNIRNRATVPALSGNRRRAGRRRSGSRCARTGGLRSRKS